MPSIPSPNLVFHVLGSGVEALNIINSNNLSFWFFSSSHRLHEVNIKISVSLNQFDKCTDSFYIEYDIHLMQNIWILFQFNCRLMMT